MIVLDSAGMQKDQNIVKTHSKDPNGLKVFINEDVGFESPKYTDYVNQTLTK